MVEPLFALSAVPGDVAAAIGTPVFVCLSGACTALWKRAQNLQDKHEAEKAAMAERMTLALERNTVALDKFTDALRRAS